MRHGKLISENCILAQSPESFRRTSLLLLNGILSVAPFRCGIVPVKRYSRKCKAHSRLISMISSVFILLVSRLYSKLSGVFLSAGFESTVYPDHSWNLSAVLSERRSTCRAATEAKLQWMREVEEHATFTLNTNYLEDYRARFEETYRMLRH